MLKRWSLNASDVDAGYCLVTHHDAPSHAQRQELFDRGHALLARQHVGVFAECWQPDGAGMRFKRQTAGYCYVYHANGTPKESWWYDARGRVRVHKRYCPRSGEVMIRTDYVH